MDKLTESQREAMQRYGVKEDTEPHLVPGLVLLFAPASFTAEKRQHIVKIILKLLSRANAINPQSN